MPRQECRVCSHGRREAIDLSLLVGWTYAEIAEKFEGVSASAVGRHRRNHWRDPFETSDQKIKSRIDEAIEEKTAPILKRLNDQLTPHATLRRAFEQAGLDSMGARTVALDKLVTALVGERAYTPASRFLENAGFDTDTARAIVATAAEGQGADRETVLLELLYEQGGYVDGG